MSFFNKSAVTFRRSSYSSTLSLKILCAALTVSAIVFLTVPGARSLAETQTLEDEKISTNAVPADRVHQTTAAAAKPRDNSPEELTMAKARSFNGDVRNLSSSRSSNRIKTPRADDDAQMLPPAPAPLLSFDGLDRASWAADAAPDTSGDAGPNHYIQAISSAIGIYNKTTGSQVAAFSFNTLMSQGMFGNLCDTDNRGNPTVLYDTFEDRWIITDFAYQVDGSNNVINPPGAFQCFAVSKTDDPVAGGWNFFSINRTDGLNDSPKFGIWTDGLYMSANMQDFPAARTGQGVRVWAFNKAQMYAGIQNVQVVSFNAGTGDFGLLPGNARLQTGTPPAGTPNYYVGTWNFLNAITVYKFMVNWNQTSLSTFTGPDVPLAATSWPNAGVGSAPTLGGASLDVIQIRAMAQSRYTNIGGVESIWVPHTVRRGNTTGFAAPRWYQANVTGGTVAANLPQSATWDPDAANVIHRFLPSLALDRAGNMALGYSTASSTTTPEIRYAGRLAGDPVNTFSQTEQTLFAGVGTQSTGTAWGEYSSMTVDPDGCTFWYTNEYYAANGTDYRTRIGSFQLPGCATIGSGSLEGTVTSGGNPISAATVMLGSRSAITNASGQYSFPGLPAGTYPLATASAPGYNSSSVNSIVVNEGPATTQDFALTAASISDCFTDTAQVDFLNGEGANVNITAGGDVLLDNTPIADQQNTSLSTSGVGITVTNWGGQTFTPSVTGQLVRADINIFCSGCTGTVSNLTVSLRDTSGGLPTGPDLATATLPANNSGASNYVTATFTTPHTVIASTTYALVIRPTANPVPGTYALTRSATNVYTGGQRVTGATSGTVWSAPLTSGQTTDAGFITYLDSGYDLSGGLVSGTKDANPAPGLIPAWGTLAWNAVTPAGTAIQFQAAASNDPDGPFNFVGPDGTSGTFFTNGGSLTQFDGFRYLKYKALFSTTDSTITPTLNDVTVCFNNKISTILTAAPASGVFGGTVNLSATLTDGSSGINGQPVDFMLDGNSVGSGVTNGSGVASLTNVSLTGINAGVYPSGVSANFAGTSTHTASSSAAVLTVFGQPTIAKAFSPTAILTGGTSTVTLTLTNPAATGALTNASFTDTLSNMSAVGGAAGGTCVGASSNTLSAGATSLSFTGITIPDNAGCTVTFDVTSATAGTHPNQTSGVMTDQTPVAGIASNSANLTVSASATWTGASSTNWNLAANWNPAVPTAAHGAILPAGALPNEPSILSAGSDVTVSSLNIQTGRTLTIESGRTLIVTNALTNNGTIDNEGSFSFGTFTGNGGVSFSGASQQTIPAGSFAGLTIDNSGGTVLGGNVTVTGLLTLTQGNITTNANILTIGPSGSISRTSGYIIGNLRKDFGLPLLAPAAIFVYPVGTANGFSPVTINATGSGSFTVSATQTFMAGANTSDSIQRYWSLTPSGGITSADITLQYLDLDVPGGATESGFRFLRKNGLSYGSFAPSSSDTATNTFTINGVTAFSDWSLGNLLVSAAPVPVSGQVREANGQGISNALVTISSAGGRQYHARTNPFGYYAFSDIPAGESYFIGASHKRFRFESRVLTISDAVDNLDFVASP